MPQQDVNLKIVADAKGFLRVIGKVNSSTRQTTTAVRGLTSATSRFSSSMRSFGASFVGFHLIRASIKNLTTFSDRMLEVKAITSALPSQFERATLTVQQLGVTTRFTAGQVAEGFSILARAGLGVEGSIAGLKGILHLASAGFISVKESADIAISAVRQFNLDVSETSRVADILVATANRTKTTVSEIGITLSFAGAFAAAAGVKFEELSAAAGVLADAGIKASRGGTALRGIIASLIDVTPKAADGIRALGLSVAEVSPATNNFVDVLQKFNNKQLDATQATQIFRKRQLAAALVLVNNVGHYKKLIKATVTARKEAERVAKVQESGLGGSLRRLRSSLEGVNVALGQAGLAGNLKDVAEFTTQVFRAIANVPGTLDKVSDAAKSVADVVKFLVLQLSILLGLKLLAFFGALVIGLKGATLAMLGFNTAVKANPFGLMASAIAGVILLLDKFEKKTPKLQEVVEGSESLSNIEKILSSTKENPVIKHQLAFQVHKSEIALSALLEALRKINDEIREIDNKQANTKFSGGELLPSGSLDLVRKAQPLRKRRRGLVSDLQGAIDKSKELIKFFQILTDEDIHELSPEKTLQKLFTLNSMLKDGRLDAFIEDMSKFAQGQNSQFIERMHRNAQDYLDELHKITEETERLALANEGAGQAEQKLLKIRQSLDRPLLKNEYETLAVALKLNEAERERAKLIEQSAQFAENLSSTLSDSFTNFFSELTDGVDSLKDALENFVRGLITQINQLILRTAFDQVFGDLFTPATRPTPGFASIPQGNSFVGPGPGVLNSPTSGLGSPPLGGGLAGQLQSTSFFGGTGGPIVINIQTPNSESFKKSERQITETVRKSLGVG